MIAVGSILFAVQNIGSEKCRDRRERIKLVTIANCEDMLKTCCLQTPEARVIPNYYSDTISVPCTCNCYKHRTIFNVNLVTKTRDFQVLVYIKVVLI